ncbi:MAG: hypothetical protein ACR2KV_03380, partial [Solirubrobacteraceae bacterium]
MFAAERTASIGRADIDAAIAVNHGRGVDVAIPINAAVAANVLSDKRRSGRQRGADGADHPAELIWRAFCQVGVVDFSHSALREGKAVVGWAGGGPAGCARRAV